MVSVFGLDSTPEFESWPWHQLACGLGNLTQLQFSPRWNEDNHIYLEDVKRTVIIIHFSWLAYFSCSVEVIFIICLLVSQGPTKSRTWNQIFGVDQNYTFILWFITQKRTITKTSLIIENNWGKTIIAYFVLICKLGIVISDL